MPPAALDFTSESFDPLKALLSKNIVLPYPKAKTYNNIAEYYSQTFLRKGRESTISLKKKEIPRERNYEWYYDTLGLTRRQREFIRRNKKIKRRKGKKPISIVTVPCAPLRSERILKCQSDFKDYCRRKFSSSRKINSLEDMLSKDNETSLTEIYLQKYTESHLKNVLVFDKNVLVSPLKRTSFPTDVDHGHTISQYFPGNNIEPLSMGTEKLSGSPIQEKIEPEILISKNTMETNENLSRTVLMSSSNPSLNIRNLLDNPKDESWEGKRNASTPTKSQKRTSRKRNASSQVHPKNLRNKIEKDSKKCEKNIGIESEIFKIEKHQEVKTEDITIEENKKNEPENFKIKKNKEVKAENKTIKPENVKIEKIKTENDEKIKIEISKESKTSKSYKLKRKKHLEALSTFESFQQSSHKKQTCDKEFSNLSKNNFCEQSTSMKNLNTSVLQSRENISIPDKLSMIPMEYKLADSKSSDKKKKSSHSMLSKEHTELINRCTCDAGLSFGLSNKCICGYYSTAMEKLRKFKIPRKKKCSLD